MFTLITTFEDLMFLNEELSHCPYIAIDTEFRRTTKDNMKLALMQVNDSSEIYLIDCLQIKEPKENCSFLSSPILKRYSILIRKILKQSILGLNSQF